MDTSWFLEINRFAERTAWAHGFMRVYAMFLGIVLLAAVVVFAAWRAFRDRKLTGYRPLAAAVWAGAAAAIGFGLNQPLSQAIGRARPFVVLHGVEVLIPRAQDFGFPSDHAVVAGAVITGLILTRDRLAIVAASCAGLLLCFARVYVGAHYPTDVLAGLGFGAVVALGLSPLALRLLVRLLAGEVSSTRLSSTPTIALVGDASEPAPIASTGSVRMLTDRPLVPQQGPTSLANKGTSVVPSS